MCNKQLKLEIQQRLLWQDQSRHLALLRPPARNREQDTVHPRKHSAPRPQPHTLRGVARVRFVRSVRPAQCRFPARVIIQIGMCQSGGKEKD